MFLFERLFGLAAYMTILILVCFLLVKTNLSLKASLRFYLLCLCIMAFFYKPYVTADLYRIYEKVDYFSTIPFVEFWRHFIVGSDTPAARLLYWCIGKIGVKALLPTYSAFVCYSLIFYVINKTSELFSISKRNVACVLFFVMTTSIYISVIGGIRMMTSICFIMFGYFRGTVEKKFGIIDILFYVISILTHSMSFVIIGICILVSLFDSGRKALQRIGYVLIIAVAGVALSANISTTVNNLYEKFLAYIFGDKHSDSWEYLMGAFIIILLLLSFLEFRPIRKDKNHRLLRSYNTASLLFIVIAVCFCFEFSIFYRFGAQLAVLFSAPAMLVALEERGSKTNSFISRIGFKNAMILLSMIIAAISCTRGSLSSLKFFEL